MSRVVAAAARPPGANVEATKAEGAGKDGTPWHTSADTAKLEGAGSSKVRQQPRLPCFYLSILHSDPLYVPQFPQH